MATGEMIGPYLLGECLGEGGFGAVFEAVHQETGQRVAIKFLHASQQLDPEVQNRFVREVALLARLGHDNIVRHFEAGLHDGSLYCAMELVECGTLKEVLAQRNKLPWREAAEVAMQTAHALDHAHQHNCIHRDLKPANLYLSEDGLVKLGDLGLARDLDASRLTTEGQTVGTWFYMPPEQIAAQEEIDGRLDIYAMGCILFEMIAGQVPFDGTDYIQVFDQHLQDAPPRLDVLVSECPKALADLVDWMLEKKACDRPEAAQIVAERLAKMLAGDLSGENSGGGIPLSSNSVEDDPSKRGSFLPGQPNLTKRLHSGHVREMRKAKRKSLRVGVGIFVVLAIVVLVLMGVF